MKYLMHLVRKYPFSACMIAVIWFLSLMPYFPETPLDDVVLIDKWVHILMYGLTFTTVWIEYTFKHRKADYEKLFFWAWLAPVAMSGTIELLQEYCTFGCRSGEWLDLAANTLGITAAAIIGIPILYFKTR